MSPNRLTTGIADVSQKRKALALLRVLLIWCAALLLVTVTALEIFLLLRLNDVADENARINLDNQRFIRETAVCLTTLPRDHRTEAELQRCVDEHHAREKAK